MRCCSSSPLKVSGEEGTDVKMEKPAQPVAKRTDVSYEELCQLVSKGNVQLFDVRDSTEVNQTGRIPGAVNIPLKDLKAALKMLDEDFFTTYKIPKPHMNDTNIVFYGLKEVKSASACELAYTLGFKKVKQYAAGYSEWSVRQQQQPQQPEPAASSVGA